jgi:hypothetical protein
MERAKRIGKAPVRLIAEADKPVKEIVKPANKPTAPRQATKSVEASQSKTSSKTPKHLIKKQKTEQRILNLDLPENPPSDDIKFTTDWGEPSNPYWKDNFYTPKDNATQEYKEATDKLINILSASFALIDNVPETFGVGNLELNPDLVKPIKRILLFSK